MRVTVAVPASVANLGPGFDVLALALQLQNDVRAESVDDGSISIDPGEGAAPELGDPARNLVTRAYRAAEVALGIAPAGVRFGCTSRIPVARGLGSSAAASLAGVLAAVALHHAPWDEQDVLGCVAGIEGHRDNAAAALLGGLAVCAPGADAVSMTVPERLHVVLFVPDAELRTEAAREVVPLRFDRADAIFNAGRCALLVRALALEDYGSLGAAMEDRWHQEPRAALAPVAGALIAAAREGGAAGAALAGAGPSVVALTPGDPEPVAQAMREAAERAGVSGSALLLRPRNYGTRVDVRP